MKKSGVKAIFWIGAGALCLLYLFLCRTHLYSQYGSSFFSFEHSFTQEFFNGVLGEADQTECQGFLGVGESAAAAGQPRISEYIWRFVSRWYYTPASALAAAAALTLLFLWLCRCAAGPIGVIFLPPFLWFFTRPLPAQAAASVSLFLCVAALALYRYFICRRSAAGILISAVLLTPALYLCCGAWAVVFAFGAVAGLFFLKKPWLQFTVGFYVLLCAVFLNRWGYTPPASRYHRAETRQQHLLMRVRHAAACADYEKCIQLCQKCDTSAQQLVKAEINGWFKYALLMSGQLNNRSLEYAAANPEIDRMYPWLYPLEYECAAPYIATNHVLELYPAQVPHILSVFENYGRQNRYIEPLLKAETATRQWRLAEKTLRFCRRTPGLKKRAEHWQKIIDSGRLCGIDGALPVALSSPELVKGPSTPDGWVKFYFPKKSAENQVSVPLLEYYTFLCLKERRLEEIPQLAGLYARLNRPLPVYVQEALCYSVNYPVSVSKQQLLKMDFNGSKISYQTAETVEEIHLSRNASAYPYSYTTLLLYR